MEFILRPSIPGQGAPMDIAAWYLNKPPKLPFTSIEILPFFNLVMVWNHGVSFGMFQQDSTEGVLFLTGLSAIISLWFSIWFFMTESRMQMIGLALVVSGAIGNIIDRVRFGAVIDFLDFHLYGWHYPAFNVADSAIVIGVFIVLVHAFFGEKSFDKQHEKTI